jgi:catechol 2,3-dioxygenase-like lactoylglutathione lyase family enzyme
MMSAMLHHVAIEVRRADACGCADFYRLLGFEPVEPPESLRDRALWLERGGTQVHLLFADRPTVPGEGHLALVVDDYSAMIERLRAAGHRADPRREHWGSPRTVVQDPAGHRVELMARPPAVGGVLAPLGDE